MKQITSLFNDLGIEDTYTGYEYLRYGLDLCSKDENYILFVWKWLYGDIADYFHKNRSCVERALRTVVNACWNKGNRELLNTIAGHELVLKPTVGEFIAILHDYLKGD